MRNWIIDLQRQISNQLIREVRHRETSDLFQNIKEHMMKKRKIKDQRYYHMLSKNHNIQEKCFEEVFQTRTNWRGKYVP